MPNIKTTKKRLQQNYYHGFLRDLIQEPEEEVPAKIEVSENSVS